VTAPQPGEIEVEDQLERRIRKPVDLLRCVLSCFGIVALAVAGIGTSATTSGVQTDLVGASHRLPHALVVVAGPVALFALLILPVAMAVQLLVRRQFRRLGEAVATGVLAAAVTAVVNDLLTRPAASRLYYAIIGALDIAGALAAAGLPVTAIRRVRRHRSRQGNPSRHYAVTTKGDGCRREGWGTNPAELADEAYAVRSSTP
jgi:hypothetical protein